MLTRRRFLRRGAVIGAGALLPAACSWPVSTGNGIGVIDLHGQLSSSRVARVVQPARVEDVQRELEAARGQGRGVSIAGGRHAMGGQQFGQGTVLLDMTAMNRVLRFDTGTGLLEVESGIEWPELIDYLVSSQKGRPESWGIVQKQTGADRLTMGGSLAANAHGRGLAYRPIVQDVEAFTIIDDRGNLIRCDRRENAELFRLAIGGYGLFGVVTSVTLRLAPRRKLERVVRLMDVDELMPAFERRIGEGFLYGDFQYATDASGDDLLRKGVFCCYRPVDDPRPVSAAQTQLVIEDWQRLFYLAHTNKKRAFETYAEYLLSTSGRLYWSDTVQLSAYVDNYHEALDRQLGVAGRSSDVLTEIFVPRSVLGRFLDDARRDVRSHDVDLIEGAIRLVERDDETTLAWARAPWACVLFSVHIEHTPAGLERSTATLRRLIDYGLGYGGSYFLAYHRWATRQQLDAAYPQFADFVRLKRRFDPEARFQSDWYRFYQPGAPV